MKAIIFDLDGVICFTDKFHYQAWKKMADEQAIPFDEKINNRLRGVSRMESLEIILEKSKKSYSEEEKIALANQKNEYYKQLLNTLSEKDLDPKTKKTIETLRNKGYLLAIGSSSKNTKLILKQIGLLYFFDAISDGNNISKSKPDPEVFLKAAEYLKVEPKDCLVVEDAVAGIEAATRGGFKSAGLSDAKTHPMVTYKLDEFSDLLKYC